MYTAIEYDGNSDRQIGYHHDDGETFEESEIRLTNKRPSPGFQAFFGVLWLPTKEAANFLGMVPRDLTRGIAGFREGLHYSGNARFRLWNIGALAKYFDMPLEVPELERAHRAMDSVHRGDCPADTGRLKGTFLFQGRKRKPIPLAPIGNTQTLCL